MSTFRYIAGVIAALTLVFSATAPVQAASVIVGKWRTPTQAEMSISSCVEGHCGYISRVVITEELRAKYGDDVKDVTVVTDAKNKDPKLRNRPIQGLQILTLRESADGRNFEGEVYNPEDGNTYNGYLEVVDANTLRLKGCALMFLCQEQMWTRIR